MIKRLCNYSGCNEIAVEHHIYCAKHLAESQKKHEEWLENHKDKKKPFENAVRSNDYSNIEWKKLRLEVLKRDGYCCQQCGATAEESQFPLEVHHIICPKGNKELFYNADNCVTLCHACHVRETQREIMENKIK